MPSDLPSRSQRQPHLAQALPAEPSLWPVPALALALFGCTAEIQGSAGNPPLPPATGGSGVMAGGTGGAGAAAGAGATGGSGGSAGAAGGTGGQGGMVPSTGGAAGMAGAAGSGSPEACVPGGAPRAPLRRITRFEYNNTVRDLLGVMSRPADTLPGEALGSGFGNDADALGVSRMLTDGYRSVAQQIATEVTASPAALASTMRCDPAQEGEDACRQKFIPDYLGRAFRRPADAEDITAYQTAFDQGRMLGGDFASGVRAVVERSLQSAQFLYRIEVGEPLDPARNLAKPTPYEMATRLSYLLWGSMPDAALFDAAQQGRLSDPAGVLAEARRMLGDAHARDSIRYFHGQLFGINGLDHLERDAEFYPSFKPGMGVFFRQETEAFLDDVVWNGAGDLATIFTAPYTFVNGPLATFYGLPNVTGDAFQKVPLDGTRRAGLLTQASILTLTTPGSRTDPVVRGKWAYTRLFCGTVDDPPPDVPKLPDPIPGQSVRERLAMHRQDPKCNGCHSVMDPLGFGFEHFDGVGQWRDMDNGAAVDASGEVPSDIDVAGPFNGVVELAQKLAQSHDVRACYAGRFLTFAYGRAVTADDDCSRAAAENAFEATQGNIKELMVAVTQTDAFLQRPVTTPVP